VFVVFRKPAAVTERALPPVDESSIATIDGPWQLSFQPNRGAPESISLAMLASWSNNADPGVKYFSGIGTYSKTINVPGEWFEPGTSLWLDLGDVKDLAEVSVNGTPLGIVWHAPYRMDVTKALRRGKNELTIKAINTWVNRLIGDQQPNSSKVTFTDVTPYSAGSPLMPSGLVGSVQILREATK
jgi:Glycosyl hydrolases family 2, sugar binding domain